MKCPRRAEMGPGWDDVFGYPETDTWDPDRGYRFCSYCGSLHPDEFMGAAEAGVEIEPTDKAYKAYLDLPERCQGDLYIYSLSSHPGPAYPHRVRPWSFRLRRILRRSGLGPGSWRHTWFGEPEARGPIRHAKFYYLHLTDAQQVRFSELYEQGHLNIGYPGYFYGKLLLPALGGGV